MDQNASNAAKKNMVPAGAAAQAVQAEQYVKEIDLVELFFTLLHSWRSIFMAILIGAVIMGAYHTFLVKPSYRATTELYITSTDSVISLQDLQVGSALTSDYQSIIKSRGVLNQVIEDLQLDINYTQLEKLISVSNPNGTHIISTSVTTNDLALSRDIANDLLNVCIDRIYQIVGTSEPTIIDFSEAEAVEYVTPGFFRYAAIGGLIGALIVAAYVTIKMLMDTTIKSDDDVEKYMRLPVLCAVPYFKNN